MSVLGLVISLFEMEIDISAFKIELAVLKKTDISILNIDLYLRIHRYISI